ncbi:hypothetical protein QUB05_32895 [Microcoleus sp. F10-C6]|uniref:hypothetical protein n=1 Tax=unclassified Microcoleus TaxID=2642155 RepID=UPI002FD649F9
MHITSDFLDNCWQPPESEYQPLLDFESDILSEVPHNDFSILTQKIKRSFLDYCRQGIMLEAVRRYRLYKHTYKDFADYCKNALGRSPFYCQTIIKAAKVCMHLIKSNFQTLPTSVAQAMPLWKFAKVDSYGNCQLTEKWSEVIESIPVHQITAAKIQETLDENPEDRAKQVRIKGKAYKLLQEKALAAGMSVSEYLEHLIGVSDDLSNDQEPECSDVRLDEQAVHVEYTPEQQVILADLDIVFKSPDDGCLTQQPKLFLKRNLPLQGVVSVAVFFEPYSF